MQDQRRDRGPERVDEGGSSSGKAPPRDDDAGTPSSGVWVSRRRCLKACQHFGHRHSSVTLPSLPNTRESRQPCCALMSVNSVSVSGETILQSLQKRAERGSDSDTHGRG